MGVKVPPKIRKNPTQVMFSGVLKPRLQARVGLPARAIETVPFDHFPAAIINFGLGPNPLGDSNALSPLQFQSDKSI